MEPVEPVHMNIYQRWYFGASPQYFDASFKNFGWRRNSCHTNHSFLGYSSKEKWKWYCQHQKSSMFPEIDQVKIFWSQTCPHCQMCIRIYFLFKKKQKKAQVAKKEKKITKETKEKKKENAVVVNSICWISKKTCQ